MTFEIGAGAFTLCAGILVFGLLSSGQSKTPHGATGKSVGLLIQSSFAPAVAPSAAPPPSPSPSAAPQAAVLPDTSNANRPTPTPTPKPTRSARPTGGPKTTPTSAPSDQPPVVVLFVTPAGAPLTIVADASQSTDTDGTPIANFVFNYGDGQSDSPTYGEWRVNHTYAGPGRYVVSVVATDTAGHSSSASMTVIVS